MDTVTKKSNATFFNGSKVISKPNAILTVKELTLTEIGRQALTSGSTGIMQGAQKTTNLPSPLKKLTPA